MSIVLNSKESFILAPILMKFEFSQEIFEKYTNIKFHENPYIGSRVVACGRTDMTKLIVAFRNFANAPKRWEYLKGEISVKQTART